MDNRKYELILIASRIKKLFLHAKNSAETRYNERSLMHYEDCFTDDIGSEYWNCVSETDIFLEISAILTSSFIDNVSDYIYYAIKDRASAKLYGEYSYKKSPVYKDI
jgi:hypothetical protein